MCSESLKRVKNVFVDKALPPTLMIQCSPDYLNEFVEW